MNELYSLESLPVLLVGASIVSVILLKNVFEHFQLPPLVAYLGFGLMLRITGDQTGLLNADVVNAFDLLAKLGIVALLFRVGLHSHPKALLAKLPQASLVWFGNFSLAAILAYLCAYYLLHLSGIAALFVAAALSTTSVGVAVALWEDAGLLNTGSGQLVLDVAELDDISGIALMSLLLAVVPHMLNGSENVWPVVFNASAWFGVKFALFTIACVLFAQYLEPKLSSVSRRLPTPPERMLIVAGLGFMIAALAGWLGFSLAIGALFAGLIFSGDPEAVRTEKSYDDLYAFLTPFFFISLGMNIDPVALSSALVPGLWLFLAAVIGKFVGAGLAAYPLEGVSGMFSIGISMVPRAEISLLIIHQASLWPGLMPSNVYAAVVIVAALSCLLTPLALSACFQRWGKALLQSTPEPNK